MELPENVPNHGVQIIDQQKYAIKYNDARRFIKRCLRKHTKKIYIYIHSNGTRFSLKHILYQFILTKKIKQTKKHFHLLLKSIKRTIYIQKKRVKEGVCKIDFFFLKKKQIEKLHNINL